MSLPTKLPITRRAALLLLRSTASRARCLTCGVLPLVLANSHPHPVLIALALLQAGTGMRMSEALALTKSMVLVDGKQLAVPVTPSQSKTHRGRTLPMLDSRVERYWYERLAGLWMTDPLVPAPGGKHAHWRTDNANKAAAALYKDIGAQLGDDEVAAMRSHGWRTTQNNRAIARGVPAEIRAAHFGHSIALNQSNYTDFTDVSAMRAALNLDEESGTQIGT